MQMKSAVPPGGCHYMVRIILTDFPQMRHQLGQPRQPLGQQQQYQQQHQLQHQLKHQPEILTYRPLNCQR